MQIGIKEHRERISSLSIQIYEVFYRKLGDKPKFRFIPSDNEVKTIENFVDMIMDKYGLEGIGSDYIYNYFVFQLDYWAGLDTMFGQKIPVSWMIGKKAFSRWIDRREQDLWHAHQTASSYKLHRGLIKDKKVQYSPLDIIESEENERKRFYNEAEGLINCNDNTTLFNHMSKYCSSCNWKSDCKKLLKNEHPKIYILRGYLKNEKIGTEK